MACLREYPIGRARLLLQGQLHRRNDVQSDRESAG